MDNNNNFDIIRAINSTKKKLLNNHESFKKKNCSMIENNSNHIPSQIKISSSAKINFTPYECHCNLHGIEAPLICNFTSFSCIIKNYFIYLQSRNLFSYINEEIIKKLKHFQKYGGQVQKIRFSANSNSYSKLNIISNKTLILALKSPMAVSDLAKITDTICCKEFQNFVSKHCYCDVDTISIKNSDDLIAQCTKSKNRY